MTASARRRSAALIARAALLAGILAIVAGILGMHTLTGTHAGHTLGATAPPSSAAAPVSMAPAGGHSHGPSAHSASGAAASGTITSDAAAGSAAACTGGLAGAELPGAACTPLAKAGSLAAPAPGNAGYLADADISSGAAALRTYTHLPDGPSPGDLSISRT